MFAIESDGELVGGAGMHARTGVHDGVAILGYWLGKAYWNKGIATSAIQQLVEHARTRGFRRVEAHVFEPNEASGRVLEKCGFTLEARLRDAYVERDGTPCDELIFARITETTARKGRPPFSGFDHVQLAMPAGQEEAARRFYGDLLGFETVPKPAHLRERGGAWFRSGSLFLHLGVDPDFRPATKAHPALRCADYNGLLERLDRSGIVVTADEPPLGGRKHCDISDPFGNRIELAEE